ncbi:MAG: TlyA family RNA methyltransferase [Polyangia bacterium]|nr:TlyA family RNA methyltransferase [Polyangia bacterium]
MTKARKTPRVRLDQALVDAGLAPSRSRAQAMILAGGVLLDGELVTRASHPVPEGASLALRAQDHGFASRGGVKLAGALDHFAWDPKGLVVLDVGASTGGFTDCLLQRGALHVIALDVGYGQLAWALRQDPRVTVLERTNIRQATLELLLGAGPPPPPRPPDAAVVDVSFISLTLVLPVLLSLLPPRAPVVALIKPQFEAGRGEVGKGGVVRDPEVRARAIGRVVEACQGLGCEVRGTVPSSLPGPKGNLEELILFLCPASSDAHGSTGVQP